MNTVLTTGTQISKDDFNKAATEGTVQVIQDYINSGAELSVQEEYGWTALHFASREGKTECVRLLIGAGANLNVREEDGYTALHLASWHDNTECVKLLVNAGADKNIRTTTEWLNYKAGSRAIDIAREQHHAEIVKLLENTFATIIQSLLRMYLKRKDYLEILSLKPDGSGYLEVKAEFENLAFR